MELLQSYVDEVILRALHEDITGMDVTTDFLLDEDHESDAYLMAKDEGVLCGMEIAARVFALVGEGVVFTAKAKDGDKVKYGDILATMHGKTRTLLKGERTALNLLQHLSGIATETRRCVDIVAGTNASIADTRKCMVGIRAMQKYAVRCGGGKNHRFNLSDGAMLKDNHIDACGGILPAITQLREHIGHMVRIEVEVRTLDELRQRAGAFGQDAVEHIQILFHILFFIILIQAASGRRRADGCCVCATPADRGCWHGCPGSS